MKVIASQGKSRYLIVEDQDAGRQPDKKIRAQVLDLAQKRLFPPSLLLSLLARGPWEPFETTDHHLAQMMAQVSATQQPVLASA